MPLVWCILVAFGNKINWPKKNPYLKLNSPQYWEKKIVNVGQEWLESLINNIIHKVIYSYIVSSNLKKKCQKVFNLIAKHRGKELALIFKIWRYYFSVQSWDILFKISIYVLITWTIIIYSKFQHPTSNILNFFIYFKYLSL